MKDGWGKGKGWRREGGRARCSHSHNKHVEKQLILPYDGKERAEKEREDDLLTMYSPVPFNKIF